MGKKRRHRSLQFSSDHRKKDEHEFPLHPSVTPGPLISTFEKKTHPCVDVFVSRRIQKALSDRFDKGSLVVHDVQDMSKVPLGLNNRSSTVPKGGLAVDGPSPVGLSAFYPRNET